ncbi:hypothetical protein ACIA8B_14855 [Micromonospora chalcea]
MSRGRRKTMPARISPPFRKTLEEWARDTSMTVDQVREDVDALVAKGWLIPLVPDAWIMTVPDRAKTR